MKQKDQLSINATNFYRNNSHSSYIRRQMKKNQKKTWQLISEKKIMNQMLATTTIEPGQWANNPREKE